MEEEMKYAYETNPNSEELLKIKKEELKELKKKAAKDRIIRLANNAKKRELRDNRVERVNLKLKTIKDEMVKYNRMGKINRDKNDILGKIDNIIKNDVELNEDIERSRQFVSQEEIESEAVAESEVSPPGN